MSEQRKGWWKSSGGDWAPPGVDMSRPSVARVYDYLLGGKDNFMVDREVGDRIKQALPEVRLGVEQQRALLRRAVGFLVREAGVRQLIDIGSGLPTAGNVHEVAQAIEPSVRVAYVDNDPIVLAHARALLIGDSSAIAVDADVREPGKLLDSVTLNGFIDWNRPVGLLLCGILHHLTDEENPFGITAALVDALPSGSYVFIHHLADIGDPGAADAQAALLQGMGRGQFRKREEIEGFFHGLHLVEPGLVGVTDWRPEADTPSAAENPVLRLAIAAVARKA